MVKKREKNQMRLLQLFIICADHWFQDVVHLVAFFKFFLPRKVIFIKFLHERERKKWDFTLPMSHLSYYLYHTVL